VSNPTEVNWTTPILKCQEYSPLPPGTTQNAQLPVAAEEPGKELVH